MKKIFYSLFAISMAVFSLTSCEDVPEPYNVPDKPGTGGEEGGEEQPEGTGAGTLLDPFDCIAAANYATKLGADVESTEDVYIKGKVVSISEEYTTNYGNASFDISNDGENKNTFKVWRALYLGNKKFTSGKTQIKVGDDVIICGKVINYYGNTPETVQNKAYLYSLNGVTEDAGGDTSDVPQGEAKGSGTLDDPYNCVAALAFTSALGKDEKSEKEIYIKGIVSQIKEQYGTQYGNASFCISDDGKTNNEFLVWRALYLGNVKYTEGKDQIHVGDEVVICGKVVNFKGNTPETSQGDAYLFSLKCNSQGGGDEPGGGENVDPSDLNGGFETWSDNLPVNWKTESTAGNATLSQSTDAHTGKYSVKVGGTASANKRLGYKEMSLKMGSYTIKFYAKAATSTGASVRPGFVPVTDGKVGSYVYGDYVNNISSSEWVLVEQTLEIPSDGTYCFVVMNSKSPGADVLIDDYSATINGEAVIK